MNVLRTAAGPLRSSPDDPWLMATVAPGTDAVDRAREQIAAGARIIAVPTEAGCAAAIAALSAALAVPLAVVGDGAPAVSAVAAGAAIVDASGGSADPELAGACARAGAALVLAPGTAAAVRAALPPTGWAIGLAAGLASDRLPRGERPWLVHVEAPTPARELAALARAIELGASVIAVRDVAAAVDYLAVQAALSGRTTVDPALRLAPELRREPAAAAVVYLSN